MSGPARFDTLGLHVNVTFWYKLESMKLEVFMLDDSPKPLSAWYGSSDVIAGAINLDGDSFKQGTLALADRTATATLHNTNTVEEYRNYDRKELLTKHGQETWDAIVSGKASQDPSLLVQVVLLTFADLKAHKFYYSVAFPCVELDGNVTASPLVPVVSALASEAAVASVYTKYRVFREASRAGIFTIRRNGDADYDVLDFSQWKDGDIVGMTDPSVSTEAPSWIARNIITCIRIKSPSTSTLRVLCLRESLGSGSIAKSMIVTYTLPPADPSLTSSPTPPRVFGWGEGKSKSVDLSSMMNPAKLAEASANLNLSLMKWRMVPDLKLDAIAAQKCLLVGSGTLGCNVARHLLMWGVRHLTFIDRGNVSYSNPVRQSLFTHQDAVESKNKAVAAAEGVKRIHPTVTTCGVSMTIPMPGHPFDPAQREDIAKTVKQMEDLIAAHDVIYLLTDSRESRWLPTMIGAAQRKIVINAALGFDSWVVMRHGVKRDTDDSSAPNTLAIDEMKRRRLGCYFCSDVLAPRDTLSDRTLDQQCTVTRPAVSALASAYAVEIMAGIVNHPRGVEAPAAMGSEEEDDCLSNLGLLPQQIRGNVYNIEQVIMLCGYFPKCIACCDVILETYKRDGFDFVAKALNEPQFLEDVTGIRKELEHVENMGEGDCDWADD
eukprot:PhF_6_TR36177/c1_g1_i1/m.52706/K08337/ATG7; ubiquitin-like modifier-activating enzyme ATG7